MTVEREKAGFRAELRRELPLMFQLAWPVVLAELGWMFMAVVDTMMVGRVGAVSLGTNLFYPLVFFGIGILLGLDTLVAQAFGAGRTDECRRALSQGIWASLLLSPPMMVAALQLPGVARAFGVEPHLLNAAMPYLNAIIWSTLPLLLYGAFRRYLQSMNHVRIVMFALVSANGVNALVNWVLIFGNWGAPALGAEGAGWATCFSRAYMFGVLFVFTIFAERLPISRWARHFLVFDRALFTRLFRLGLPSAAQIVLEFGVFAVGAILIARIDAVSLAAHQVAISVAGTTFMVPLGISSAGAIRVGQAIGRGDPHAASFCGWSALMLGAGFMLCAGVVLFSVPGSIVRIFTTDTSVFATGVALLYIAAVFQLFDGLQVVSTGILRGTGDTKTPMLVNLAAHWAVGLPLGWWLGFRAGWGAAGVWTGLSAGLILVGAVLLAVWTRKVKRMAGGM